jgi:hypothetical protein
MRQLILSANSKSYFSKEQKAEIEKYSKEAEAKKLSYLLEADLLHEIRKGNKCVIPKLVDSWEHVIITVIKTQINSRQLPIEKMILAGKDALTLLAERELSSCSKEVFFRFGGWWVRQGIMKLVGEKKRF